MVNLTPEQQQDFINADDDVFAPASGAWGRQGCATVRLALVNEDKLGEAMTLALQNTAKGAIAGKSKTKGTAKATKKPRKL